jgi:glycosyltransferase involved in cell wall biosynthesis
MTMPERVKHDRKLVGLFTDLLGVGGVQEAGRLTAAALKEIATAGGWSLEILSLNDSAGEHALPCGDAEIKFCGFGRDKPRYVLSATGKALRTSRRGTAIIVAAHPHLAVPACYMQRVNSVFRTIVMSHGIEVWNPLSPRRYSALQKASMVLAPSNYTAREIADKQNIAKSKIRRLPWPLNPALLDLCQNPSELPLPANFPKGKIILTVGRWAAAHRYKGIDSLIQAAGRLRHTIPDLQLVAVGSGDDVPRLREIAAEQQVKCRVHFLETLSQEEVAACYANSDVFALPSTGEGFGLVFLEAMAFAKPVVGVNAGGATDLVRDGVNGLLIPPNDVELLAQGLGSLLQDESLRRDLGECGAAIVRREYQFSKFSLALKQCLCDVASKYS